MMGKSIAVLGHWHTGSSLLARTLQVCGMRVGNENTGWNKECEAQCEHGELNGIGDGLVLNKINFEYAYRGIQKILKSYVDEAGKNNWEFYGVKITHALHSTAYPVFTHCFDTVWKDTIYFTTIRHPLGIIASTGKDVDWSIERILNSINDTRMATKQLIAEKKVIPIMYPNSWLDGSVRKEIEKIGLVWNEDAEKLFDEKRIRKFSEKDLIDIDMFGEFREGMNNLV